MRIILITCFLLLLENGFSQSRSSFKSFLKENDSTQSNFLNGKILYQFCAVHQSIPTSGSYGQFGVNLSRFFTHKMILGISVDFRAAKGFTKRSINSTFLQSFNESVNTIFEHASDSARTSIVANGLNQQKGTYFQGNYFGGFGIQFSPFPLKYGGIILNVSRGYASFPIYGHYGNQYINNYDSDFAFFDIGKVDKIQLFFKPLLIGKSKLKNVTEARRDFRNWMICGVYYERFDFKNAHLHGTPFFEMVNNDLFLLKTDHRFGFTIGFGI
jgi:hypothetical protein